MWHGYTNKNCQFYIYESMLPRKQVASEFFINMKQETSCWKISVATLAIDVPRDSELLHFLMSKIIDCNVERNFLKLYCLVWQFVAVSLSVQARTRTKERIPSLLLLSSSIDFILNTFQKTKKKGNAFAILCSFMYFANLLASLT